MSSPTLLLRLRRAAVLAALLPLLPPAPVAARLPEARHPPTRPAHPSSRAAVTPPAARYAARPAGAPLDDPPNVWFTPGGGTVASGTLSVTVHWCDDGGLQQSSRQVKLDGGTLSTTYTAGSYAGCAAYGTSAVSVTLAAGQTRTLAASIRDNAFQVGSATTQFTGGAVAGGAGTVALVSPKLYRDPARCALDCGELVQTVSTPAYMSLDVPRSLTLVYRSGRAKPLPVVELDVSNAPAGTATLGLKLLDANNAAVALTSGGTEVVRAYAAGTNRLAAQFDAGGLPTGAPKYTAVVTAYSGSGAVLGTTPLPGVRVLVDALNGPASPYGAGWGVAGLRQARWHNNDPRDGEVIVDGDGTMAFYPFLAQSGATYTYASPPGDFSAVTWDANTGVLTQRYPDGTVVRIDGANGAQTSVSDRFGNTTAFAYSFGDNRLTAVTDPAGQVTWMAYFGLTMPTYGYRTGALGYVSDPAGRNTAFWGVDSVTNDVRFARDAALQWQVLTYDGAHRLTQAQDPRGGAWNYGYDPFGGVRSDSTPAVTAGGTSRRLTTTSTLWAAAVLAAPGTGGSTLPALRADTVRARVTGPDGLTTRYALDGWGAATRIEAPGGAVTTTERDANGNVTRAVSPSGHEVRTYPNPAKPYLVDSTWDVTTGARVRYTYDAANYDALATVRGDVAGVTNTWSGGRLRSTRPGAAGPVTTYEYGTGADPRPTRVVDQNGHGTRYYYAAAGLRNTDSVRTGGGLTKTRHDAFGRVATIVNVRGDSTRVEYDALNRVTATVDGLGDRTTTEYDALFPTAVVDALQQRYATAPNALGLPVTRTDPAGRVSSTTYDAAGRVATVTNRRGQTVTMGYSPQLGGLARVATPDNADVAHAADPLGRWSADSTRESIDTVFYDVAGRPQKAVHVIRTVGPATGARYEIAYTYDVRGRRTAVQLSRPGSWTDAAVAYTYTPMDQLETMVDRAGATTRFNYNQEWAHTGTTLPNGGSGTLLTFGATALHTQGSLRVGAAGALPDDQLGRRFRLDTLGRLTVRQGVDGNAQQYAYDAAGRLKSTNPAVYPSAPSIPPCQGIYANGGHYPVDGEEPVDYTCPASYAGIPGAATTFQWDAVGNPVRSDVTIAPNSGNRMTRANNLDLIYDDDGNLRARFFGGTHDAQRLTWNSLGQLTGVWNNPAAGTGLTDSVTFGYDGSGRRVRKTNVTTGATSYFVWDGDDLLAELDGAGGLATAYAYYPGVDRPHSARRGLGPSAPTYYYVVDPHPGHVAGLLKADGTLAARYAYGPWGAAEVADEAGLGGWRNPLRYGAREYDAETGLYYNRARYYDPALGRFVSEDPVGLAGGVNLYAYAAGDPVNGTDPSGLLRQGGDWECVTWSNGNVTCVNHSSPSGVGVNGAHMLPEVTFSAPAPVGSTSAPVAYLGFGSAVSPVVGLSAGAGVYGATDGSEFGLYLSAAAVFGPAGGVSPEAGMYSSLGTFGGKGLRQMVSSPFGGGTVAFGQSGIVGASVTGPGEIGSAVERSYTLLARIPNILHPFYDEMGRALWNHYRPVGF